MTVATPTKDPSEARTRTIRARNRALLIVLVCLVALFYVLTFVRMGAH